MNPTCTHQHFTSSANMMKKVTYSGDERITRGKTRVRIQKELMTCPAIGGQSASSPQPSRNWFRAG
jgi:hypothetical protein